MWPFSTVTEPKRFTKASACSPSSVTHPQVGYTAIVSGSIFAWRWSFQMQAVNMLDQLRFRGRSAELGTQHLIRLLGGCLSDPQADQQAGNAGGIHLDAHPVEPLAQQMAAAQHTFDPTEKQLRRPPIAIRQGQ